MCMTQAYSNPILQSYLQTSHKHFVYPVWQLFLGRHVFKRDVWVYWIIPYLGNYKCLLQVNVIKDRI